MNGIKFDDIHSYNDLHLIMQPFAPTPAKPKTSFLKVPGRDGTLDLTEANGGVKYNDRVFTFTFTVAPGDTLTFDERVTAVSNAINGRRCKITLDRDPAYYWVGRCEVNKLTRSGNVGKIVIKATVQPYKVAVAEKTLNVTLSTTAKTVTLTNGGKMAAVPSVQCVGSSAKLTVGGNTYTINTGNTVKLYGVLLVEGNNSLSVSGSGTVKFIWQEGAL